MEGFELTMNKMYMKFPVLMAMDDLYLYVPNF